MTIQINDMPWVNIQRVGKYFGYVPEKYPEDFYLPKIWLNIFYYIDIDYEIFVIVTLFEGYYDFIFLYLQYTYDE
jgi:hypothetical protein